MSLKDVCDVESIKNCSKVVLPDDLVQCVDLSLLCLYVGAPSDRVLQGRVNVLTQHFQLVKAYIPRLECQATPTTHTTERIKLINSYLEIMIIYRRDINEYVPVINSRFLNRVLWKTTRYKKH